MKKFIDAIGWVLVVVTIIILVGTLITSYQFRNILYFRTYCPVELSVSATTAFWGIKLMDKRMNKRAIYPIVFILIALVSLFFYLMKVY